MTGRDLAIPNGLTPPDCDLRDFGHMPLDVRKFRDSDLVALEDADAVVAAIMLWGASWHQLPAASLPDDDRVLANLAGYGKVVKEWLKVRKGALRGFVKCADGRLYHPLVAEKARTAWEGKLKQRWRTFCATIRKHNERHPESQINAPEYETWLDLGRPEKVAQITFGRPSAGPLFDEPEDPNVTRDNGGLSDVTSRATNGVGHADVASDMASKGKGKGKGKGEGKGDSIRESFDNVSEADELLALTARITAAAGVSVIKPQRLEREIEIVRRWRRDNVPTDLALSVIAKRLRSMPESETVSSLAFFDAAIRKAHSLSVQSPAKSPPTAPPALTVSDDDDPRVSQLRDLLKRTVGATAYEGWLKPTALSFNGSGLKVVTPSPFMRDWVASHFSDVLAETAKVANVKVVSA